MRRLVAMHEHHIMAEHLMLTNKLKQQTMQRLRNPVAGIASAREMHHASVNHLRV